MVFLHSQVLSDNVQTPNWLKQGTRIVTDNAMRSAH